MSEYEELQLLNQLRRVPCMGDVPATVRRLYRKLCVRRLKRERGMALFNLDDIQPGQQATGVTHSVHSLMGDVRILDRFQVKHKPSRAFSFRSCNKVDKEHCHRGVNYIVVCKAQFHISSVCCL